MNNSGPSLSRERGPDEFVIVSEHNSQENSASETDGHHSDTTVLGAADRIPVDESHTRGRGGSLALIFPPLKLM